MFRRNVQSCTGKNTAILRHAEFPINWISNSSNSRSISFMKSTCSGVRVLSISSDSSTYPVTSSINFDSMTFLSFRLFSFTRTVTIPPFSRISANLCCIVSCRQILKLRKSLYLLRLMIFSNSSHLSSLMLLEISQVFPCAWLWCRFSKLDYWENSSCTDRWGWPNKTYCLSIIAISSKLRTLSSLSESCPALMMYFTMCCWSFSFKASQNIRQQDSNLGLMYLSRSSSFNSI